MQSSLHRQQTLLTHASLYSREEASAPNFDIQVKGLRGRRVPTHFARPKNALLSMDYGVILLWSFTHHIPLESACQRDPGLSVLLKFQVGFLHLDQSS